MKQKKSEAARGGNGQSLRQRAERRLNSDTTALQRLPADAVSSRLLIDELRIHQAELELQNEELCEARQRLEAAILRYWEFYTNAPIGYLTLDANGLVLEANLSAAQLLDCDRCALPRRSFISLVAESSQADCAAFLYALKAGSDSQRCELTLISSETDTRVVQLTGKVANEESPDSRQTMITMQDISRRRLAEDALHFAHGRMEERILERTRDLMHAHALLRQSESRLSRAQNVAKIGVWELDLVAGGVFCSDQIYDLLELERDGEVLNINTLAELVHPQDQLLLSPRALQNYVSERRFQLQARLFTSKARALRYFQVYGETTHNASGRPTMVIGTAQDITALMQAHQDRLRVEQAFWHAQLKMGSSRRTGEGLPITNRVDLNHVVLDVSRSHALTDSLHRGVSIAYELFDQLPVVDGDPVQLGQVVMFLIANTAVSLAERGGTVLVRTGTLSWDTSTNTQLDIELERELASGDYVLLEVGDSGFGTQGDPDNKTSDPISSTRLVASKPGLSIVLGIVHNHGGTLGLGRDPTVASRYHVLLPSGSQTRLEHEPH